MTLRERLKQQARRQASGCGHTLGRFKALHNGADVADCTQCGDTVYVVHIKTNPYTAVGTHGFATYSSCQGSI